MGADNIEYSVVLTSCGRFDLLRPTVESFLRFADVPPQKFVIVEDSGDDKVRAVLAAIDAPFEFVLNRPRLGQAAAIDAGYARVKTPFVFHCEDDWEFFRGGFVAESAAVLNGIGNASGVFLRGREEHKKLRELPSEELNGARFFRTLPGLDKYLFGYSYNPGLRRLADYRRVAPLAKIGGEREVSFVFKRLGYYTAHLEIPAVRHLGWGRHVRDIAHPNPNSFWRKKLGRYRGKAKILKWEIFGVPFK